MADEKIVSNKGAGSVSYSNDVISVIAGLATTETPGITSMSGGIVGGIAEMLGRKNLAKGIKVEVGNQEAALDLYVVVDYGVCIPEVCMAVQENVKKAIENMTGLKVVEVNINVQGVNIEKDVKEADTPRVR